MKKRILSILLAAALVIAVAAGCVAKNESSKDDAKSTSDSAAAKTKVTFVLDWAPNTNHTGLYVAQAKGYFEEAGLDVEIIQPGEDTAEMMVGTNRAQFGISFQDSMLPTVAGDGKMPVTAVAAVVQHNTSGIISLKGKGMDTPKGMEGHKYATWDLPIDKGALQQVVQDDGGECGKGELIPSTVTD